MEIYFCTQENISVLRRDLLKVNGTYILNRRVSTQHTDDTYIEVENSPQELGVEEEPARRAATAVRVFLAAVENSIFCHKGDFQST